MPNTVIDTTAAAYTAKITRFEILRDYMRPHLNQYYKLDEDQKLAWRQSDKLLRMCVHWIEKFNDHQADNGEADV